MTRLAKAATTIRKEVRANSVCSAGKLTIVVDSDILIKHYIRFCLLSMLVYCLLPISSSCKEQSD